MSETRSGLLVERETIVKEVAFESIPERIEKGKNKKDKTKCDAIRENKCLCVISAKLDEN